MKYVIVTFTIVLLFTSCKTTKVSAPISTNDHVITVKFIQVNDVYEIAPLGGGLYGGMERVAYVADSIKKEHPNTMLFMAGDFLNPSLLGTLKYEGERLKGKQMIEVMNAMDFDLVTFGNHEFDIGEADLQKRLDESTFQWTSANVFQKKNFGEVPFVANGPLGRQAIPKTYKRTFTDVDSTQVTFGFFSVTVPSNPRDFVHYRDIFEESKNANRELVGNVDKVIGFTHLTLNQDKEVSEALPNIELIMGGHEHSSMLVPTEHAIIAKADANAKTIYIHTLTYNDVTKNMAIDSHLMPIDETVPSHPEVKAIVDRWNDILNAKIKEVISDPYEIVYVANPPLDGTDSANRSIQTNLGEMITAGMAGSFDNKVDAALVNGGSIRIDDMLPSNVASIDMFRTLPFGGSVVKVKITGALLKEVLDYGMSKAGTGAYLQRHNITENATYGWNVGDSEIDTEKVYTIAFSDFLLKGYDIPFLKKDNVGVLELYEPKSNELAYDIRKAIITYMKSLEK